MRSHHVRFAFVLASAAAVSSAFGQLTINLNPNASLSSNPAALAAFRRAADTWQSVFTDPITVTINAGLQSLGSGIIGSTSSVELQAGYDTMRNQMVADASNEPSNSIVSALPTSSQFRGFVPSGDSISGSMLATKANLKAMGFTGLDASFGAADATINFSSNFSFDFDNRDGVSAGKMDFETVALHEIGHALGFISGVDDLDVGNTTIQLTPLDLFRFQSGALPTNASTFTTAIRELRPGAAASFSDTANAYSFATGANRGDGSQASHWKADELTGHYIGVMDPTLDFGQVEHLTSADLRAFDLIGWDVKQPVPEPASFAVLGLGAVAVLRRRKKA